MIEYILFFSFQRPSPRSGIVVGSIPARRINYFPFVLLVTSTALKSANCVESWWKVRRKQSVLTLDPFCVPSYSRNTVLSYLFFCFQLYPLFRTLQDRKREPRVKTLSSLSAQMYCMLSCRI